MPRYFYAFAALILCVFVLLPIGLAIADNASFKVQPQNEHLINLSLRETDSVTGSFSTVSDDEIGIVFYVTDPDGKMILRFENISQKSFSFVAQVTGNYQLHFDNSFSTVSSKTVALNYDITHYTMGMPQEQFLLIVIAAVALIGILAYAVLMPK